MATKTQSTSARKSTAAHTRTRGSAKTKTNRKAKRGSGWKTFLSIFGILAVVVGTVLLILEFGTEYKPSNGFKKVTGDDTEQTERLPDEEGNGGELPAGLKETKPDEGGESGTSAESGQEETL